MQPNRPPCMNKGDSIRYNNNAYQSRTYNCCPPNTKAYTIMPGDTLYGISMMTGISIEDILSVNPQITDPNMIYAGHILCIPFVCDGFLYVIKPGDTLYTIALSFGITVNDILDANPMLDPNYYQAGETICIPEAYPCPGMTMLYVVKYNDTLSNILKECNISLNALLGANPSFDPVNIQAGTRLCVIPTPCEPMCDDAKKIPAGCKNIDDLAANTGKTTDEILLRNPNYPPCYFAEGHSYCMP